MCSPKNGDSAFDAGNHEVLDADVSEGAAGHDAVVAAARAVGVEVEEIDAFFGEETAGGAVFLDRSGGGDVVGGDGIAEDAERARALDLDNVARLRGEAVEERRLLDVGGFAIPFIDVAGGGFDLVPLRILVGEAGVEALENIGAERGIHRGLDLGGGGPDVFQENRMSVGAEAEWLGFHIDIDRAGDGEGDDEGRGHEEVRLDRLVDAGFEVAVSGKDGGGDDVLGFHDILDAGVERAGVADAGGAAVADGLEAELVELYLEAGLVEVIGDDARARAERCFH